MISPSLAGALVQFGVAFPVGLALLFLGGVGMTLSFAAGAIVYIVPNAYFTLYAFRHRGARLASQVAHSFIWGEFGKLALVTVGFAVVFQCTPPLHAPLVFAGFCSMIAVQWWLASHLQERWLAYLTRR